MKRNNRCGLCESKDLVKVIDLGEMPLANAFLTRNELNDPEPIYPLVVYFCRSCFSVQLLDIVNPDTVFRKYEYLTSASIPLSEHFIKMGNDLCYTFGITKADTVIEIGGNDGVLLDAIKHRCSVMTIDPAEEAGKIAESKGVPTIHRFFDSILASTIWGITGNVKLIIANNVMAHISNIRDAFLGVKLLLGNDGVFVFEVHWLGNLVTTGGFDQIYHEHIFYHSLLALNKFVKSLGMVIFDVEMVPIHGESMRVFVAKDRQVMAAVFKMLAREKEMGLDREETFTLFSQKIFKNKKTLVELCRMLKREANKIVGYGAPAKGNTLLNYYKLNLDYIIDTTPLKQGLFTPGMHIPVYPPERLIQDPPDYIILLAWNYAPSILLKEQKLIERGVKFITPVPVVQITEAPNI